MRAVLAILLFIGFVGPAAAQALRSGDTIHISVWQDPKLDQTVVIGPDGSFGFPLAGHIRAAGRSPQAVEDILKSRLQKNYTGALDITVSLAAINKQDDEETKPRVYVTGEVLRPGPVLLTVRINVMQAIAMAGGLGPFAAKQRIQLHRKVDGSDRIFVFDYRAYTTGSDTADNLSLRSGDVIIVPERGLLE